MICATENCTNCPYLPTCKAKADEPAKWRRNQAGLHVLYPSQADLFYAVHLPSFKQASLRNSIRSLKERRVESLGSLNKSCTVRNTRGLPFNAPYACTGMHKLSNLTLSPNLTHNNKSQRDSTKR